MIANTRFMEAPSGFEPLNKGFADHEAKTASAILSPSASGKPAIDPNLIQPTPLNWTQPERAEALLVLATDGRMMRPEPQHLLAILDFVMESK